MFSEDDISARNVKVFDPPRGPVWHIICTNILNHEMKFWSGFLFFLVDDDTEEHAIDLFFHRGHCIRYSTRILFFQHVLEDHSKLW